MDAYARAALCISRFFFFSVCLGQLDSCVSPCDRYRSNQHRRLTILAVNVRASREAIADRTTLASKLLLLAERARQMETDREKVAPFSSADSEGALAAAADEATAAIREDGGLLDAIAEAPVVDVDACGEPLPTPHPIVLNSSGRPISTVQAPARGHSAVGCGGRDEAAAARRWSTLTRFSSG